MEEAASADQKEADKLPDTIKDICQNRFFNADESGLSGGMLQRTFIY